MKSTLKELLHWKTVKRCLSTTWEHWSCTGYSKNTGINQKERSVGRREREKSPGAHERVD